MAADAAARVARRASAWRRCMLMLLLRRLPLIVVPTIHH